MMCHFSPFVFCPETHQYTAEILRAELKSLFRVTLTLTVQVFYSSYIWANQFFKPKTDVDQLMTASTLIVLWVQTESCLIL